MGPKKKITKSGWEECAICKCTLLTNDVNSHVQSLHTSQWKSFAECHEQKGDFTHGFIKRGIIHGFAKLIETKGLGAASGQLDALPDKDDLVLLSKSVMTLSSIAVGDLVVVWTHPEKFIFQIAWPAKVDNQFNVSMSERTFKLLSCEISNAVHVQHLEKSEMRPAFEISLEPKNVKPFYESSDFLNFFLHSCNGKLATKGVTFFVPYYGQFCELVVTNVAGIEKSKLMTGAEHSVITDLDSSSAIFDTCEGVSKLSLSYTSDYPDDPGHLDHTAPQKPTLSSTPLRLEERRICTCERSKPQLSSMLYYVTSKTKVRMTNIVPGIPGTDLSQIKRVTFEDIGGLHRQIKEIQQLIFPEFESRVFSSCGIQLPKGILLFGPSGTGKTLIARALMNYKKYNFVEISGPEVYSKFYGETEAKIQEVFREAKRRAPSIVFIDEIDTLCSKRDSSSTRQEQRVVATLLFQMDTLSTNDKDRVVVLATTSKPDSLDPAMRRPGRLDREIEIGIPTATHRKDILLKMLRTVRHNLSDAEIRDVADSTHGFVGADLAAVCAQAGLNALERCCVEMKFPERGSPNCPEDGFGEMTAETLTYADLAAAVKVTRPSGLRELLIEVPKVYWEDVGGQDVVKSKLKQMVEWPLTHPEAFQRMGISPSKGILMYGPPGCSKTLIAKALATESGLNFIAIKGPELFQKWVGESERAIREVFRKARAAAPSIVFIDEIDSLAAERGSSSGGTNVGDRVLAQLLLEMDGLEKLQGVSVIASTNRPDMIDKALLRPGRLDHILYIPLPDEKTREEIIRIQARSIPFALDVEIEYLVRNTKGYSGAEVVAVCREAALQALQESLNATDVNATHFLCALNSVQPRISKQLIQFYDEYGLKTGATPKSD